MEREGGYFGVKKIESTQVEKIDSTQVEKSIRLLYNITQVMSVVIEWQSYDPLHGHACMRRLVGKRPSVAFSFISFKLQAMESSWGPLLAGSQPPKRGRLLACETAKACRELSGARIQGHFTLPTEKNAVLWVKNATELRAYAWFRYRKDRVL